MASGDNVDAIEVVETSFAGPAQPAEDSRRAEQSAEEDNIRRYEDVTGNDNATMTTTTTTTTTTTYEAFFEQYEHYLMPRHTSSG
ncbi:hypothetical protein HZH66_004319 [Vespula vulgaris]|uniref:Uncharacterized protein n=1 Tax=Vespula vulgaris TaxID=7454 RepID=A0A834KEV1_VESVU|nr:hypothetical protein HZH66_004319 [Vespula vulgaris]